MTNEVVYILSLGGKSAAYFNMLNDYEAMDNETSIFIIILGLLGSGLPKRRCCHLVNQLEFEHSFTPVRARPSLSLSATQQSTTLTYLTRKYFSIKKFNRYTVHETQEKTVAILMYTTCAVARYFLAYLSKFAFSFFLFRLAYRLSYGRQ